MNKVLDSVGAWSGKAYLHSQKWVKKGSLAVVDQGLISGSNFLVAILLARWLVPEQYGIFALAYECCAVIQVAFSAMIIEPLSVFGPSEYRDCLQAYWGVLVRIQVVAAMISVLILGGGALILREFATSAGLVQAVLGVMVAVPCIQFFYTARAAMYVKLTPWPAMTAALLYSATVVGGLVFAYVLRVISPLAAFLSMAAAGLLAGGLLIARFQPQFRQTATGPRLGDVIRKHWIYGRWALAGSALITLSASIYYPLLGKFSGLSETAALKALDNLYSPVGQLIVAFTLLLLPYAARRYHDHGVASVERLTWNVTWLYSGGTAAYWLVLLVFWPAVAHFLYGGKYMEVGSLVPMIALSSIARNAATVHATALRAIQSPSLVFVAFSTASVIGAVVGIPVVWAYGIRGAVFAMLLSNTVALVLTATLLHRSSRAASRLSPAIGAELSRADEYAN